MGQPGRQPPGRCGSPASAARRDGSIDGCGHRAGARSPPRRVDEGNIAGGTQDKAMQKRTMDGLMRTMADPRFQTLMAEFYEIRGTVAVENEDEVRRVIGPCPPPRRWGTTARIPADRPHRPRRPVHSGHRTRRSVFFFGAKKKKPAADVDAAQNLVTAAQCVTGVEDLAIGPAFTDSVTVLHLFCQKMGVVSDDIDRADRTVRSPRMRRRSRGAPGPLGRFPRRAWLEWGVRRAAVDDVPFRLGGGGTATFVFSKPPPIAKPPQFACSKNTTK